MTDLWQRLKQRKLVQWALAYVAFAFALLQAVDIVATRFAWPGLVEKLLILALCIGFVVTLILAWYHGEQGRQRVSGIELIILAVVLAVGGGFLWYVARPPPQVATRTPAKTQASPATAAKPGSTPSNTIVPAAPASSIPAKSIAVLPFVNDSGDSSQRYFSDGLSESLIITLSQYPALTVIGRNSSFQLRHTTLDSKQIGRKLGVATLLEGSVSRAGDEVRVRAELVSAASGRTLWSDQYDRPYKNLFALQDDLTKAVATALKTKLLGSSTTSAVVQNDRPPSGSLVAYNDYLQGNYYTTSYIDAKKLKQGIAYYQKAIQADPRYTAAYAGLSIAWSHLSGTRLDKTGRERAYASAKAAADQALKLDPLSAAAHAAQGLVFQYTLHIRESETEFRRAVTLDPSDPTALRLLAYAIANMGDPQASLPIFKAAIRADPLNVLVYEDLFGAYSTLGKPKLALGAIDRAIKLQPSAPYIHAYRTVSEIMSGDPSAALASAKAETDPGARLAALAYAYQATGEHAEANRALTRLIAIDSTSPTVIANIYAYRGNRDKTFEWLDLAWRQRDPTLRSFLMQAFLGRYKNDPRYTTMCRNLGVTLPGKDKDPEGSPP